MQDVSNNRRGVAAVEFAIIAPIFVVLMIGIIEMGRGLMVQQILVSATRMGAREASLPSATKDSVRDKMTEYLAGASVKVDKKQITVTPDPAQATGNEQITVSLAVPYKDVRWIKGPYLNNRVLRASTSMRSERLD